MTKAILLARYTYMKTGGPADEVVEVTSIDQLKQIIANCRQKKLRFFILGGGSNTLFTDAGFRGVVIINRMTHITVDQATQTIEVESGCPVNLLVNQASSQGLAGLEWYLGLPGTVGGAIYNNSHFKTHLIGEIVKSVTILDSHGNEKTLSQAECDFNYDSSRFHHSDEIILKVVLQLTNDKVETITQRAQACLKERSSSQPLSMPSSGCMFQNPPNGLFAGKLIDDAGMKGKRVGDAMVSPIHANFIVNTGHATASQIMQLANQVAASVKEKFGITLKREVFYINEFGERMSQ